VRAVAGSEALGGIAGVYVEGIGEDSTSGAVVITDGNSLRARIGARGAAVEFEGELGIRRRERGSRGNANEEEAEGGGRRRKRLETVMRIYNIGKTSAGYSREQMDSYIMQ
jgi:hypothetical protein